LIDETGEFAWRLGCDSLDITLENEEVLSFDEDIMGDQRGVVCGVRDDS
jgi:hypothetical protein